MKTFNILFFLVVSGYFFGQSSISIHYSVEIRQEESYNQHSSYTKAMKSAIGQAKNLNFVLLLKSKQSFFYAMDQMRSDNEFNISKNLVFAGYTGHVYQKADTIFHKSDILGNNIYRIKPVKKDWTLTKETKIIDGFLCFMATSINRVTYKDKIFNHSVVAWYCPEIPYYFGPNGYSGLPGLILELTVRNVTFFAQKINFNSDENFKIDTSKMKILDEEAFSKALDRLNDF